MKMERVILLGTAAGTGWRAEMIGRLVARGVALEKIVNPHLPPGIRWTPAHMKEEQRVKRDPQTIIFIYVCPAVVDVTKLDSVSAADKAEWLGPASMKEIGQYGWGAPQRTAIVLDYESFVDGGRPRKVLLGFVDEMNEDFEGSGPPYFATQAEAEDWIVGQLTGE
ncbi:MAG TPA: hypothetical protein VJM32_02990 [Candidatus Saccharimonadales bacterium]|nr:hypothetical protein [Candidatus Saccharimonadales bacterium]